MSRLLLAPMEGVTDWVMRDTLTRLGAIDQCVTEFLRVTDRLHPDILFFRNCPELHTSSRTRSGTPVFIQLLGGQPEPLAMNAQRAVELGAIGIDLNFGCPAKTVNRHDGGATLLQYPQRIFDIIKSVRAAVPASIPVSAKIRLGFDKPEACFENAIAAKEAGAEWLTIHCRTKLDGYKPPAFWEWIPRIREVAPQRIIANGEIWNLEDFKRCQEITQCREFMMGRGAMSNPWLFKQIRAVIDSNQSLSNANLNSAASSTNEDLANNWQRNKSLLMGFFDASTEYTSEYFAQARTKQWLKNLALKDDEARPVFDELKVITDPKRFKQVLSSHC